MRKNIQTLQNIVSRKGSSKILTFSIPHVFKALQMLAEDNFVSRATFGREIHIGEGAVKTLILHLKEAGIADTTKSGTFLTENGKKLIKQFNKVISNECSIEKSATIQGKFNHAILLKNYSDVIKTGLEQRDYAILYGSSGCITVIFRNNRFVFPRDEQDCFEDDPRTKKRLLEKLSPQENDVIIISSSNDPFVAEISAKNSALWTLATS
ncbi:MAG: hypothetical protein COW27_02910 [Nitrosopumilales archaeon CG15_BIG_FIL_POST_REV_8_21_14_020_37_12]|nr:MAG: hypothetical protein COW27_02910 [Nitrosopumilales archaeon CG15_BIG_FIL_POST_REV_8_21_14_020_37_12]